jgi:hypothetical protein
VIAQVFSRQPYTGSVDWNELYTLIGDQAAYIDVHTATGGEPVLRGTLLRENANWRTFTHAFCS